MINIKAKDLTDAIPKAMKSLEDQGRCSMRNNQDSLEYVKETALCLEIVNTEKPRPCKCSTLPSLSAIAEYELEFIHGVNDGKYNYTYHELYAPYFDKCIEELKNNPYSRRAVLPVAGERSYSDNYPPCLQNMLFSVNDGALDLTVLFRSNDAVKAFPSNLFVVNRFLNYVAKILNFKSGKIIYIANNFHCYSADIPKLIAYNRRFERKEIDNDFWTFDEYQTEYKNML